MQFVSSNNNDAVDTRSKEELGRAGMGKEDPGGGRRRQEEPGRARRTHEEEPGEDPLAGEPVYDGSHSQGDDTQASAVKPLHLGTEVSPTRFNLDASLVLLGPPGLLPWSCSWLLGAPGSSWLPLGPYSHLRNANS